MSNTKEVRVKNSLKALRAFMSGGGYTKNEIADKVDLTLVTSSKIINQMLADGIILESGIAESDYGRKASVYVLNPKRYYICGLAVGLNFYSIEILDLKKEPVRVEKARLDSAQSFESSMQAIIAHLHKIFGELDITPELIVGIGVTLPGVVDSAKGRAVVLPNMPSWNGACVKDVLQKEFGALVIVEKDNFASILYLKAVSEQKLSNAIVLTIMGGVGCGILIDGCIYRGENGLAGEIGHLAFGENGEELESLSSDLAITAAVRKGWQKAEKNCGTVEIADVIGEFKAGDPVCREVISQAAKYLSMAVTVLIRLYNPRHIFIDAIWVRECPKVFSGLNSKVKALGESLPSGGVKLVCIKEEDTVMKGASMLVYDYIMNHGTYNKLLGA